jgi:hypothetical protein
MEGTKPPIEMTLAVHSDIYPWRYPPLFYFQYGDWLRDKFESGVVEPWQTKEMPDLAVLITQVHCGSLTLFGKNPEILLPQVPQRDFIQAMHSDLERLVSDLDSDTRNVLLTLARIWTTFVTKKLASKPDAADWAIERLPVEYQPVMQRAKAICIGLEDERWNDLKSQLRPCAEWILRQITTMK